MQVLSVRQGGLLAPDFGVQVEPPDLSVGNLDVGEPKEGQKLLLVVDREHLGPGQPQRVTLAGLHNIHEDLDRVAIRGPGLHALDIPAWK